MLCLHFYVYCFAAFQNWRLSYPIVTSILINIGNTGLFKRFYISKLAALILLQVSLVGTKRRKDEKLRFAIAIKYFISGLVIYLFSYRLFKITASAEVITTLYTSVTSIGYLLTLNGGALLSCLIKQQLAGDIFNRLQETVNRKKQVKSSLIYQKVR